MAGLMGEGRTAGTVGRACEITGTAMSKCRRLVRRMSRRCRTTHRPPQDREGQS